MKRIDHDGDWGVQFCRFRRTWEVWINQPNARRTRILRLGRFVIRWQPALGYSTPAQPAQESA